MKFPTQHIKKLTLAITKAIVVGVVFVVSVSIGVFNILIKSTEHKVNAKTRNVSDESKIHPKNTNYRDIIGYPARSVK